jgi:phage tail sheath gpL-like
MSGTATESGSIAFYIGGERFEIGVESGDTGADIATALKAELALSKNENIPVNYGGTSGTVDIEVKNGGAFGNELDLRINHYEEEELPGGISVVVTQPASGAVNPDVSDAIAAMGAEKFNLIIMPYTDTSNLNEMQTELETRWGPLTQNDGQLLVCKSGDDSALNTLGDARNNAHECILGYYKSPTAPWKLASMAGGQVALAASIDPARPFQTLKLKGALAALVTDRFTMTERNNILSDGIATLRETVDGGLMIDRLVTTYKTNSLGAADTSYRDANTLFTLSFLRYDWNLHLSNRYPRHKLADDGTRFSSGQAIVTPSVIKAEAINKFREWEFAGLVEGFEQFKEGLIVERNASDVNRIDVLLPPDVVNQLIIAATQIQFIL